MAPEFEPCKLRKGEEGDAFEFIQKIKGFGYNDMCDLPRLNPDTIMENLRKRFAAEIVYTNVGDIIVSVNPFKNTGCVGKAIRQRYQGNPQKSKLPPHIYALVDDTYRQVRHLRRRPRTAAHS